MLSRNSSGLRRRLIIRGDLCSHTGLAYVARGQMRLLENDFDIIGVDVHPDPNDRSGLFPYGLISDTEISRIIASCAERPVVLHHTPPDDFRSFPGAINVGFLAWETDVTPRLRQWDLKIAMMDAMWALCSMVADSVRSIGYTGPLHNITWPFDFSSPRRSDPKLRQGIKVRIFGSLGSTDFEISSQTLAAARTDARNIFVSVQSLAARKGLPVLLREWQTYISEPANSDDLLILRLAFRHNARLSDLPEKHLTAMLRDAGFSQRQDARIGVIADTLSDPELTELFQTSDAYVSTTFGEGFGGPIVEAIVNNRPVIAPRHTAMRDYIPADYPLIVGSERRVVGLRGGLRAYPPASSWHLPTPGALASHLATFANMTESERAKLARGLRNNTAQFCSVPVVRQSMQTCFHTLLADRPTQMRCA